MTSHDILHTARHLCQKHEARLLYLCIFGSRLYGTNMPGKSDYDFKGVFLPSLQSLLLEEPAHSLHISSALPNQRNCADDYDLELWSAQNWLLTLLARGQIPAIDLLFSFTSPKSVLWCDERMALIFREPQAFVNPGGDIESYCLRQTRKYAIQGSRCAAIKNLLHWLDCHESIYGASRLGEFLPLLLRDRADGKYCQGKDGALLFCGKMLMPATTFMELKVRLQDIYKHNCPKATNLEKGNTIDWKAVAHALRALEEIEEFMATGKIVFPRPNRAELLAIKQGKYSWAEAEKKILAGLATLRSRLSVHKYERQKACEAVLALYDEKFI